MPESSTGKRRGRPATDPLVRVLSQIQPTNPGEVPTLEGWPRDMSETSCWSAPSRIWFEGRPQTPIRTLFALVIGEQPAPNWWLSRVCPTTNCCNPHHHRVRMGFRAGCEAVRPPLWLLQVGGQALVAALEPEPEPELIPELVPPTVVDDADVADCIEVIEDEDLWRELSAAQERLGSIYGNATIEAAWRLARQSREQRGMALD